MAKTTKKKRTVRSSKLNGQEYLPPYQFWVEKDFWADEIVSRGMTWMQRHLYKSLLQAAFYLLNTPISADQRR